MRLDAPFSQAQGMCMKLAGFLLLFAGWAIVVAAVVLLIPANARTLFVLAGVGVEIIGLTLVIRSNPLAGREKE
jgi:cytochrome c biogenesis protein CcdA